MFSEVIKMSNLSTRKLDDDIYTRLRIRAAEHHVSMEEEVRLIISQSVAAPEHIGGVFQKYFGHKNGVNLELLSKREPHDPMGF
jgi:plasmid stability protein